MRSGYFFISKDEFRVVDVKLQGGRRVRCNQIVLAQSGQTVRSRRLEFGVVDKQNTFFAMLEGNPLDFLLL